MHIENTKIKLFATLKTNMDLSRYKTCMTNASTIMYYWALKLNSRATPKKNNRWHNMKSLLILITLTKMLIFANMAFLMFCSEGNVL